jgi:hypothetical protein
MKHKSNKKYAINEQEVGQFQYSPGSRFEYEERLIFGKRCHMLEHAIKGAGL